MKCTKDLHCRRPKVSDFNLQHDRPEMFVAAQFGPPWVAVVWHGLWSAYFTTTLLVDILVYDTSQAKPAWLISSINWAYLLVIFTSFVEFLSRLATLLVRKDIVHGDGRVMIWYMKVQWVFVNVNNVITVIEMVLYIVILNPELNFVCLNRIISPTLYVLLTTTIINVQPVKLLHLYQPVIFAVIFVSIASIVQKTSSNLPRDKFIFRCDKPLVTGVVTACVIVIVIPLMHLLFYTIFKLRIFLCKKRFDKFSGSTCSLQAAIQRDITATDVVLEDNPRVTYVDLKPDVKDDIALHLRSNEDSDTSLSIANRRVNKSEADLREYRSENGLYCDFAPSPDIYHHLELEEKVTGEYSQSSRASGDTSKGSQIILVKACNGHVNEAFEGDSSCSEIDNRSNASSDFLSEYINQEILAYM